MSGHHPNTGRSGLPEATMLRAPWLLSLLAAAITLAGCGSGSPTAIVARVGPTAITHATLLGWMAMTVPEHLVPDPPHYNGCIERQDEQTLTSGREERVEALHECEAQYQALVKRALGSLISARWLIGEAADRHLGVPSREVDERVREEWGTASPPQQWKEAAALKARANLLALKIVEMLRRQEPKIGPTQAFEYYRRHARQFSRRELRYLELAENYPTLSAASTAKRAIESGASLAKISLHEVIERYDTSGRSTTRQAARDAIFEAPPHVLSGPVLLNRGYTIFEVTRIVAPKRQPFEHVERSIIMRLDRQGAQQRLAEFIHDWRNKWTVETDCAPGYVVQECRQYRGTLTPISLAID
ncbi:MAG: peptidyl-prolyl cis-trans isomerase [Phenylobacterium sp.]|nr:MAG: peptidyl-prolyl cis-trans isomerase [Phenylobacterium sp.]